MPGLTRGFDRLPAGISAAFGRAHGLHPLSRRGATLLLVLLLFILAAGMGAWRWQTSAAHQAPTTIAPKATPLSSASGSSTSLNVMQQVDGNGTATQSASSATSSQRTSPAHTSTQVQVNGETIPLPNDGNGTIHREITTDGGNKASVDITIDSNSSNSNSSSVNLNVDSSQSSVNNSE